MHLLLTTQGLDPNQALLPFDAASSVLRQPDGTCKLLTSAGTFWVQERFEDVLTMVSDQFDIVRLEGAWPVVTPEVDPDVFWNLVAGEFDAEAVDRLSKLWQAARRVS